MVVEVRAGVSMRAVARLHHVRLFTVQWWLRRAGDLSLGDVDWSNRSPLPGRSGRTEPAIEDLVLMLRRELRERSASGSTEPRRFIVSWLPAGTLRYRRCGPLAASSSDVELWMAGDEAAAIHRLQAGTSPR